MASRRCQFAASYNSMSITGLHGSWGIWGQIDHKLIRCLGLGIDCVWVAVREKADWRNNPKDANQEDHKCKNFVNLVKQRTDLDTDSNQMFIWAQEIHHIDIGACTNEKNYLESNQSDETRERRINYSLLSFQSKH